MLKKVFTIFIGKNGDISGHSLPSCRPVRRHTRRSLRIILTLPPLQFSPSPSMFPTFLGMFQP